MPTLDDLKAMMVGTLPEWFGLQLDHFDATSVTCRMTVRPEMLAPNGYLHGGAVVTLADTTCGYGTLLNLPEGGQAFTTIELKTNFLGTTRQGSLLCEGTLIHGGRTTQVWDARVIDEATQQTIALFRCTQLILYPRSK